MSSLTINIGPEVAEKILDHYEELGISRELFMELAEIFLEGYYNSPCRP